MEPEIIKELLGRLRKSREAELKIKKERADQLLNLLDNEIKK